MYAILFIILISAIFSTEVRAKIPSIRVKIGSKQSKVVVRGMDLKNYLIGEKLPREYFGIKAIKFNCKNFRFKKKAKRKRPILLSTVSSPTGLISWNKTKYRGELHILTNLDFSSCDIVNKTKLDNYISALLAREMNATWPIEVLKAQAIAARSYALHKIRTGQVSREMGLNARYDIESSERHQVGGNFLDETLATYKATALTRGVVLLNKKSKLLPIFYHSKCGGKTFRPQDIWDNKVEGYQSVPCNFCQNHGKPPWKYKLTHRKLRQIIGRALRAQNSKIILEDSLLLAPDRSGQEFLRIYNGVNLELMKKSFIRRFLGRDKIPSNNFKIKKMSNKVIISGTGNGHGVGMCQFGALVLAQRGRNYKEILSYYYPGLHLEKRY